MTDGQAVLKGERAPAAPAEEREPRFVGGVLCLLICLLPLHEAFGRLWQPLGLWDDLLVVATAVFVVWQVRTGRHTRWWPAPLFWCLAAFASVFALSAAANRISLPWVVESFRSLLLFSIVAFAAAQVPAARVRHYLTLMVVAGILSALYGLASFMVFRSVGMYRFMPHDPDPLLAFLLWPYRCGAYTPGWHLAGPFLNDNFFGVWLVALTCIAAGMLASGSSPRRRLPLLVGIVLFAPALAWTGSRGALVAFVAATVVLAVRVSRRALAVLALMAVWAPLFITPRDIVRFTNLLGTDGGRIRSCQRAIGAFLESPLLGLGPSTRGLSDMHYAKILYETGGLGLAAFLALLGYLLFPLLRNPVGPNGRLRAALGAGMLALCVSGAAGEVWEIPQLAYGFWMLAGFSLSLGRDAPPGPGEGA